MAGEQRKLAHASKRDSSTMKTISLLGSVFLLGAYLGVSLFVSDKPYKHLLFLILVDILHNVLQLSKCARHTLSRIPRFLTLLGGNNTSNFTSCWNVAMVGKKERGEVR